jgi:hypothetical protein
VGNEKTVLEANKAFKTGKVKELETSTAEEDFTEIK